MSHENEDVKPKLNLSIVHDGKEITVKVKPNTKFSKIFAATEAQFKKEKGTFKFVFDGNRVTPDDTPASLGMEDGDKIDAFLEQLGGTLCFRLRCS